MENKTKNLTKEKIKKAIPAILIPVLSLITGLVIIPKVTGIP